MAQNILVLGFEIILKETEVKSNNKYSVDILLSVCPQYFKGELDKIGIGNQYCGNYNSFSRLITYVASNEGKYDVWFCEKNYLEHKKTIDLLNCNSNFYLYKRK